MSDSLRLLLILLLVLGNAVFVAAEYALVTARRTRLMELAHGGNRRAKIALRIMDDPVRFIGTVQLGITAFSIALGAVGEPLIEHFLDPVLATTVAFILAFGIVTYLHVTLGELVPKAVALTKNEGTALWVALPIEAVYIATYPLVWFLQESSNAFTRLFGIQPAPAGVVAHSEEDIRHIVAAAEDTGVIEEAEEEMVYKIFDFADKEVHEVMVPRPEVVAISIDLPPVECLAAVIDSPYTRYPVYRGSLDDTLGILHVRDLFSALYDQGIENVDIAALVREAYVVPETKDLASLLAEFRRQNQHLALVVDEYGAVQGIVTLEDLLEEIVGEIQDEYDWEERPVERLRDGSLVVDGTLSAADLRASYHIPIPESAEFETVAGFMLESLGTVPRGGEFVDLGGHRLTVVDVEKNRISKVKIDRIPVAAAAKR